MPCTLCFQALQLHKKCPGNTASKPASPIIPTMTGLSDGEAIPSM